MFNTPFLAIFLLVFNFSLGTVWLTAAAHFQLVHVWLVLRRGSSCWTLVSENLNKLSLQTKLQWAADTRTTSGEVGPEKYLHLWRVILFRFLEGKLPTWEQGDPTTMPTSEPRTFQGAEPREPEEQTLLSLEYTLEYLLNSFSPVDICVCNLCCWLPICSFLFVRLFWPLSLVQSFFVPSLSVLSLPFFLGSVHFVVSGVLLYFSTGHPRRRSLWDQISWNQCKSFLPCRSHYRQAG